jgi:hypothetical protein
MVSCRVFACISLQDWLLLLLLLLLLGCCC